MVADSAAMQYIMNSPHFAHAPLARNMINLLFGEKSVLGLQGAYLVVYVAPRGSFMELIQESTTGESARR
jgi:hypothetical protein